MLLTILDYCGIVVFAITGALVGARHRIDVIGFMWLATVTGVGGGTVRDLILGRPVFWLDEPLYLYLCLITAAAMFFVAHWIHRYLRWVLWFDALGLALYAVIGTRIALESGAPWIACTVLGVLTATLGGVLRDLLAGEPTLIVRKDIYITAAAVASFVFLVLEGAGAGPTLAMTLGISAGFAIRALALKYTLSLPGYRWLETPAP